jgi:phage tail-like protein
MSRMVRARSEPPARERPCAGSNFLVDLGLHDPQSVQAGFAEVLFPTFLAVADGHGEARLPNPPEAAAPGQAPADGRCLILRRGVCGQLDLAAWWAKARRGTAPQRRTVKVVLLAEDRHTPVLTWRFRQARPAWLHYSPLRALDGSVLMETMALHFDSVEIS